MDKRILPNYSSVMGDLVEKLLKNEKEDNVETNKEKIEN